MVKSFLKTLQKSIDKYSLVVYRKYIAREHKSIQGGKHDESFNQQQARNYNHALG